MEQLQDLTKQLFSLSFESKQEAYNESPNYQILLGYPCPMTKGPQNINWKVLMCHYVNSLTSNINFLRSSLLGTPSGHIYKLTFVFSDLLNN